MGRPGRVTGARIETPPTVPNTPPVRRRPGRVTGARIETIAGVSFFAAEELSPRSRDRGAD